MSVSNVGDVTSLTGGVSTQSAGGNIQVVSLSGGVSTMSSSGATTCYKKKTCSEGGYYSSVPTDQKCSSKSYNGYTCYYSCSYKTCSDYGYKASIPSGQTCTTTYPRSGLTCYKDCKDDTPEYVEVYIEYAVDEYAYSTDYGELGNSTLEHSAFNIYPSKNAEAQNHEYKIEFTYYKTRCDYFDFRYADDYQYCLWSDGNCCNGTTSVTTSCSVILSKGATSMVSADFRTGGLGCYPLPTRNHIVEKRFYIDGKEVNEYNSFTDNTSYTKISFQEI